MCAIVVEVVNKYSRAYDGHTLEFAPLNMLDVEHVIDALSKFRHELEADERAT